MYLFIQGYAVGIMGTCVPHSDFAYASENAYFKTSNTSIIIGPEMLRPLTFPSEFGRKKISELFFLDKWMTEKDALVFGSINGILNNEETPSTDPIITDI